MYEKCSTVQCTVHCTMYAQCSMCTLHCRVHCTMYAQCSMCTMYAKCLHNFLYWKPKIFQTGTS